jgi:AraC-like DNA-binding protein
LLASEHVELLDVRCDSADQGWSAVEEVVRPGLVLVRSGVFRRRADGEDVVLDPTTGYVLVPGSEERLAHPCGGDTCTAVRLSNELFTELARGRRASRTPLRVDPRTDVAHRRLLAEATRGGDPFAVLERAFTLITALLRPDADPPAPPRAALTRRRLVEQAKQHLASDPSIGLRDLAAGLAVSPWHLSRVFHGLTGTTLTRYRQDLRTRRALDLLAADLDLATVAVACGYADQPHLTRSLRHRTGHTPGELARLLAH